MLDKIKVLIVDDAPTMRNVIKGALLNAGFSHFSEAENGQAAINLLNQESYHLVICDLEMPKVDGLAVLRTLRTSESMAKIPFIMVSAISNAEKVVKIIEEGVNDYVIKPIKPDAFARRVKEVLKEALPKLTTA